MSRHSRGYTKRSSGSRSRSARPSRHYLEALEQRVLLSTSPSVFTSVGIGGTGTDYWVTVNPNNPRDIYAESDMGIVWHSVDGGLHWTDLNQNTQITSNMARSYVSFSGNVNVQYAINNGNVERTADDGNTWTVVPGWTFATTAEHVIADPNDPTGNRIIVLGFTRVSTGGVDNVIDVGVTSGGSGYTNTPNVTITGGGGSGATAKAVLTGNTVTGIILTNVGTGYTTTPNVTISGGGGSGAQGYTETDGNGSYYEYTLYYSNDGGNTFQAFANSGGGTAATATAAESGGLVTSLNFTNTGTTYATPPVILITGGGGSGATAIATVTNGSVSGYTITNAGSGYTTAPNVTIYGGGATSDDFKPMEAGAFFDPNESTVYYATEEGIWKGTNLGNQVGGVTSATWAPYSMTIPVLPTNDPASGAGSGLAGDPAGYNSFTGSDSNGTTRLAAVTFGLQEYLDGDPNITANPGNTSEYGGIYTQEIGTDSSWVNMDPNHKFGPLATADPLYARDIQMVTGTSDANGDINDVVIAGGDNLGSGRIISIVYEGTTTDGETWTWTTKFETGSDPNIPGEQINQNIYERGYGNSVGEGVDEAATFLMDPNNFNIMTFTTQGNAYETVDGGANWYDVLAGGPETPTQWSVAIANGGVGYSSNPTVSFSGGGGSGATATASEVGGVVVSITITNLGTGYTAAPTVALVGGGYTTQATATATLGSGTNTGFMQPTASNPDPYFNGTTERQWANEGPYDPVNNPTGQQAHAFYASSSLEETATWMLAFPAPNDIVEGDTDLTAERSTDGGITWQFPSDSSTAVAANTYYDIVYDPTNNIMYAVTSDVHNLYIGEYDDGHVDNLAKNHVIMSTDDGATWTSATGTYTGSDGPNTGLPFAAPARAIAIDPDNPNVAYLGTANANEYPYVTSNDNLSGGGLWMTTDLLDGANATWTYLGGGNGALVTANISGGQITSYTVNNGGSGYDTSADTVAVISVGGGSGATASVTITNGVVTAVNPITDGSGYSGSPVVSVVSHTAGAQPTRDINGDGTQDFSAKHINQLFVVHDDQWATDGNTDPNHEMVVAVFALRALNSGGLDYSAGVWTSVNDGKSWTDRSSLDGTGDDLIPGAGMTADGNLISSEAYSLTIDPNVDAVTGGHDWFLTTYNGSGVATNGDIYKSTNEGQSWTVWSTVGQGYSLWFEPGGTKALFGAKTNKGSGIDYIPNYQAANPQFIVEQGFPFGIVSNIQQDPFNPDTIWLSTFGTGAWKTSLSELSAPQVVQNLIAQGISPTEAQLSWTVEAPIGTSYSIQYSTSSTFTTYSTVTDANWQDSSFIVTGLSAGTEYYFRVLTTNSVGNSNPSNVASTRTDASTGLIASEEFTQATGALNGTGSGTGWSGNWSAGANSAVVSSSTHSFNDIPNGTAGLPDSAGNIVQVKAISPNTDPARSLTTAVGTLGSVIWVSFLAEALSTTGIVFGDSATTGFGFGNTTGSSGNSSLAFYTISGGTYTWYKTNDIYALNTDHYYAARLDFESDGIHVNLYLDPLPGQIYPGQAATWALGVSGVFADPVSMTTGTTNVELHRSGTAYYDEIRIGSTYASVTPKSGLLAPAAPTSVTATPAAPTAGGADGNPNEIDISWVNGSQTNPQQGELIEESINNGTPVIIDKIIDPTASVTSYAITNLTGGPSTNYKFLVATYNNAGTSSYTSSSTANTVNAVPNPVTNVAGTTDASGNITLTWSDPTTGVAPTGYIVQYTTDNGEGYDNNLISWNSSSTLPSGTTTYTPSGLTANKLYYFRVFAVDNGGYSLVSGILASAPGNLSATGVGSTQIELGWTDLFGNETGYSIQQSTNGSSGWTTVGTAPANANAFTVTGLTANTQYFFRVAVVGSGYSGAWTAPIAGRTLSSDPLVYEGFDYSTAPASNTDMSGQSGGVGFSGAWSGTGATYQVSSGSLVGSNSSVANNLLTTGNAFNSQTNGVITRSLSSALGGSASGGTYWASVLVQENESTPSGLVILQGSDGVSNVEFGFSSNLYGIILTGGHGTFTGGTTPTAGSTHLLVLEVQYGSTNTLNLWVDPNLTAGTPNSSTAVIQNATTTFQLPTFNGIRIQGSTTGSTNDFWDELRVGNSFASVAPEKVPNAPTNLTANPSGSSVSLSWQDNSSNPQETGFYLQRSTDQVNWTTIYTAPQNTTTYTDTPSTGGTYYYRVDAYNTTNGITNESIYSNISSATTTTIPAPPTNLVATPGTSSIGLTWTDPSNTSNVTGYHVYRSTDNATWGSVYATVTGATATSYTDTGASAGVGYYYKVDSYNGSGDSTTGAGMTCEVATFSAYDGFNYTSVTGGSSPWQGGSGVGIGSWTVANTTNAAIVTGGLSYSATDSHSVVHNLTTAGNGVSLTLNDNATGTLSSSVGGGNSTVWVGFEFKATGTSYNAEVDLGTSGNNIRMGAGVVGNSKIGVVANVGSNNYTKATSTTVSSSATYFLVYQITYATGGDVINIYLDPVPGVVPTTATATLTLPTTALLSSTSTVLLTQNSSGSNVATFDELRIGTSYLSVAPDPLGPSIGTTRTPGVLAPQATPLLSPVSSVSAVLVPFTPLLTGVLPLTDTPALTTPATSLDFSLHNTPADYTLYQEDVQDSSGPDQLFDNQDNAIA